MLYMLLFFTLDYYVTLYTSMYIPIETDPVLVELIIELLKSTWAGA
jgi:hypothetical protein